MSQRHIPAIAAVLACLTVAACAPEPPCPAGTAPQLVTTLFFGTASKRGAVTEEQWRGFVDDTLADAFRDGFTVVDGDGFWTGSAGPLRERSKVVIVSAEHLDGDAQDRVIEAYKRRFHQESVGRSIARSCGSF